MQFLTGYAEPKPDAVFTARDLFACALEIVRKGRKLLTQQDQLTIFIFPLCERREGLFKVSSVITVPNGCPAKAELVINPPGSSGARSTAEISASTSLLGIVRRKRGAQCTTHAKRCQQRLGTVLPGTQRNAISCQQGHHVAMVYARKIKG